MSADTLIQDPYETQSYNRYSYVRNNPLKYTDPSGHSFTSVIKAIIMVAIVIAVTYATLGAGTVQTVGYFTAIQAATASQLVTIGLISGFATGAVGALMDGATIGQALIAGASGALIGGLTAGLKHGLASNLGHTGNYLRRAVAHGMVSGVMNKARGGNFGNGFMSTFFSTLAGGVKVGTQWVQGAFQTIVGGTASAIGGGKFANGAVSSAMVYLFNDSAKSTYPNKAEMIDASNAKKIGRAYRALSMMGRSQSREYADRGLPSLSYSQACIAQLYLIDYSNHHKRVKFFS